MADNTTVQTLKIDIKASTEAAQKKIASFKKTLEGLKETRVGNTFTTLAKRMDNFGRAFRRILTYKTIRSGIGLVVKGFSEGIKNLYQYGEMAGTVFSTNMDKMASSAMLIKNSVAAMVSPILNEITPAVEALAQKFADLANSVGLFFARILGQPYQKATSSLIKFGEAAKEAKKQIFGFDELNILNAPSGKGTNDVQSMFETVDTSDGLGILDLGIIRSIRDADWTKVGRLIADKLNLALDALDATEIGSWIGKKINQAVGIVSGFLEKFDFRTVGNKVAELLSNALNEIDFKEVGKAMTNWFLALPKFLVGFIEKLDWGQVGTAVKDFLVGAMNALEDWFANVDWVQFGQDLRAGLKRAWENFDFLEVAKEFAYLLGEAIGAVVGLIAGFFTDAGEDSAEGFIEGVDEEDMKKDIYDIGAEVMKSFWEGLKSQLPSLKRWWNETVIPAFDSFNLSVFNGTNSRYSDDYTMRAAGGYVPPGDLFYANERGPELIGNFGGRTEVYNQDTFASALASAIQPVVTATMAIGTQISGAVSDIQMPSVRIGDREIYQASQRGASLAGTSLIQGGRR